jgi:hypothetical protein
MTAGRVLGGDQVFLNLGTHAAIPSVPGLEAARPLTHIEALELDYLPSHLVVLGGGYVGLENATGRRSGVVHQNIDSPKRVGRPCHTQARDRRFRRKRPGRHPDDASKAKLATISVDSATDRPCVATYGLV